MFKCYETYILNNIGAVKRATQKRSSSSILVHIVKSAKRCKMKLQNAKENIKNLEWTNLSYIFGW